MIRQQAALTATDLQLSFQSRDNIHQVLSIDTLQADPGEHLVITGPSGAGKTTLLYVLTGIERPDRGQVVWNGRDISVMTEGQRDSWRKENVGFIFQDFFLFAGMSILQNVLLPTTFAGGRGKTKLARASMLLERVGISSTAQTIETLSRGERQRVAIARALLLAPKILVADEPTASLDRETGGTVIDLLLDMAREEKAVLCCVSHDPELIGKFTSTYWLENGRLRQIERLGEAA